LDVVAQRVEVVANQVPEWMQYLTGRLPGETPHALDDFFIVDTLADYTQTTHPTGTATPQIAHDLLSWSFDSQPLQDVVPFTKAFGAISPPITIEAPVRLMGEGGNMFGGVCFADGTATTSNVIFSCATGVSASTADKFTCYSGTATLISDVHTDVFIRHPATTRFFVRLVWKTTNTFRAGYSLDGVSWSLAGVGDITDTQTPTRLGLLVSSYSNTNICMAAFDYLRVYEADLLS
jgi:hypothetical protein